MNEELCSTLGITLSLVRTSNNVEAALSNATSRTILLTRSNVDSTLFSFLATTSPFLPTVSNEISSFRQSRNKLNNIAKTVVDF